MMINRTIKKQTNNQATNNNRKAVFGLFTLSVILLSACTMPDGTVVPGNNPGTVPTTSNPAVPGNPSNPTTPGSASPTPDPGTGFAALGIKDAVDLRQFDGPVEDQFGGTCSAFGTAAAFDNALKQKGINKTVSERDLWDHYGVYDITAAVQAANSNFIAPEADWPVNDASPAVSTYQHDETLKITQFIDHQYDLNAALQALSQSHPVVIAIQVPDDLGNCAATIGPNSPAGSGQHVLEAVGYALDASVSGGGYLILKNSWGPDCGDHGYHYFPFSLCSRSDLYCYFEEIVSVEDTAASVAAQ